MPDQALASCRRWTEADEHARAELLGELDERVDGRIGRRLLELCDLLLRHADALRELGLTPLPVPAALIHSAARMAALIPRAPFIPPAAEWIEAVRHPVIMDTSKATEELGWRPRYTGLEALRDTLRRGA